ncbi:filaggrin [Astyanax mexicanus]|uniref:filaggrin n=1 Tax=Astyanax mexicanus TaxID=7994 RepID=UPI0020CB16D2|nr:filaggrin [Astyanax mexicanus]
MGCRLSGPWPRDGMGVNTRDLSHIRKREALRILASYEQPITLQIEGRRGRSLQFHRTSDCSTQTERNWDPIHTLAITHGPYSDRPYYNHMTLPGDHGDGSRYEYLPNAPRDLEDRHAIPCHDPEMSAGGPQGQNCLLGCCNSNLEEPSSFQSQTEDEDYMLEKTMGYLPLHHELDSGLGWTDGSFHQGELSGVETEEGLEECHPHRAGGGGGGGSPSSESFISSELSDSGFYSVSTGEFLRFQRLLEKRMRLYNARMHHQGELRDNQKGHRELEAIPEALTVQPQNVCVPGGIGGHPRGLFRVSSVQFKKAERPSLNRHSSSSGALFPPHAGLSTCSTPSSQRRLPSHHSASTGMLRRSRTLHHRQPQMEHRRRASHPASPNYCMTLQNYGHRIQQELTEESETDMMHHANHPAHHANQAAHHTNQAVHHGNHPVHPADYTAHHANHPTHHANQATHHANHQAHPADYATHHANQASHHSNHPTHPADYATHHPNQGTHIANQANHLANHLAHHANHPAHPADYATHHANQASHHSNHPAHPADYATHHANQGTHHANQATHHPNHLTHPADYTTHHVNHATAHRPHHTHPAHATLAAHATLPTQHAQHAHRPRPKHAISQPSLTSSFEDPHCDLPHLPQEPRRHDGGGRSPNGLREDRSFASEPRAGRQREGRFHTLSHTPSQEVNDTWPKPASRQSTAGLYSTLEGHVNATSPTSAPKPPVGGSNPRAVRNQLLRDRALRLADERSGMSTDEESHCEIRTGRYWSRTERREHMMQKKARSSGGSMAGMTPGGANAVLELSQKKLSRLRNRKLLDDWTTVEELLTHGNRLGAGDDALQIPSSLLTVTTV